MLHFLLNLFLPVERQVEAYLSGLKSAQAAVQAKINKANTELAHQLETREGLEHRAASVIREMTGKPLA